MAACSVLWNTCLPQHVLLAAMTRWSTAEKTAHLAVSLWVLHPLACQTYHRGDIGSMKPSLQHWTHVLAWHNRQSSFKFLHTSQNVQQYSDINSVVVHSFSLIVVCLHFTNDGCFYMLVCGALQRTYTLYIACTLVRILFFSRLRLRLFMHALHT